MNAILLILSVLLSSVRNILSKGISELKFGTKQFFSMQAVIFICGSFALIIANNNAFNSISLLTVCYGLIYGMLLLSSQYCYTYALKTGNIGICSTIYSFGFILPTLSGSLFWNEKMTIFNIIGILLVIPAIIISGTKPSKRENSGEMGDYIVPLVLAMLSSGGLGIMQKVQQNSAYPEQKGFFVIFAFAVAGIASLIFSLLSRKTASQRCGTRKTFMAIGVGTAFAFCNLLNTILAGRIDSAIFFPVLNISTILLSMLSGIIFYKEKISRNDFCVLGLGIISILLITVM